VSTNPRAYYNEFDPKAAAWLRELVKAGHIAPGDVDERSITDVQPSELAGYTQCHFFAGIGGWSYALRLAGWPDSRSVWTGSCPCQPFSAAGKRGGTDDARHLWPEFYRLIRERRPAVVFGEQVASKDGLAWLDIVSTNLENTGYAVGAADICAAGVGAPHIRQRLWFVADSHGKRQQQASMGVFLEHTESNGRQQRRPESSRRGATGGCSEGLVADADRSTIGRDTGTTHGAQNEIFRSDQPESNGFGASRGVLSAWASVEHATSEQMGISRRARVERTTREPPAQTPAWGACDFIPCTDGKARPIESGTFPLAHGVPHRVGLLRGYGNAIVPQVAAEFIGAYLECYETSSNS
jgi:DNA (cytosine-5)-methyltransferase 1